ncbi:unnamed protein product [Lota lota]
MLTNDGFTLQLILYRYDVCQADESPQQEDAGEIDLYHVYHVCHVYLYHVYLYHVYLYHIYLYQVYQVYQVYHVCSIDLHHRKHLVPMCGNQVCQYLVGGGCGQCRFLPWAERMSVEPSQTEAGETNKTLERRRIGAVGSELAEPGWAPIRPEGGASPAGALAPIETLMI